MGSWDTRTTYNYRHFLDTHNLSGTFSDLLEDDVYLINSSSIWSNISGTDFLENIKTALSEHESADFDFVEIDTFGHITIYKVVVSE